MFNRARQWSLLSQMYPGHTSPSYIPKINSNVIFPFTPKVVSSLLVFRPEFCISHLSHAC